MTQQISSRPLTGRSTHGRLGGASNSLTIAKRNLRTIRRNPDQLLDVTLQPVVFVLIFGVVLGGAIQASTGGNYINYLMAGIFVQTAIFGSVTTGLGLAEDLQKGLMDRFRSLPMGRSSVMVGRALSDLVRSLIAIVVMIVRRRPDRVRPGRQSSLTGSSPWGSLSCSRSPSRGSPSRSRCCCGGTRSRSRESSSSSSFRLPS